jgi:hypothetical protein
MQIRTGRYGKFLACTDYPECKTSRPILVKLGKSCPKCIEGELVEKKGRSGRPFFGCARYPACDWVSFARPLPEPCEVCGGLRIPLGQDKIHCMGCDGPLPTRARKTEDGKPARGGAGRGRVAAGGRRTAAARSGSTANGTGTTARTKSATGTTGRTAAAKSTGTAAKTTAARAAASKNGTAKSGTAAGKTAAAKPRATKTGTAAKNGTAKKAPARSTAASTSTRATRAS